MKHIWDRKDISALQAEASETEGTHLKRTLGAGSLVALGVGAIIGAGSVVTKDVAPHSTVAGNPAQILKQAPINADV